MTEDQAESVADMLRNAGYRADVHNDYSGRGMMGAECIALSTDAPPVLVGFLLATEDVPQHKLPLSTDSMGKATVYY